MLEKLALFVFTVSSIAMFVLAIKGYLDLPTVYWSSTSNACVKIELSDDEIVGCENLNKHDQYNFVWVQ